MAITKSAKKALRQSERKRARNLQKTKKLRAVLKQLKTLVSQKKIEEAKKLLPQAYKLLDKAAQTDLIKKNNASRKKSRLTKLLVRSGK
jgi:small subunit ribosomal protein S20